MITKDDLQKALDTVVGDINKLTLNFNVLEGQRQAIVAMMGKFAPGVEKIADGVGQVLEGAGNIAEGVTEVATEVGAV
jgi:X-X-X-Leu-X-X-Gly heptad repeat protein